MPGTSDLASRLRGALGEWASGWHPKLAFGPAERSLLEDRLYRLMVAVGGEPLDEENLPDFDGVAAWAISAASAGLDRHFRGLAAGLGPLTTPPVRWQDTNEGASSGEELVRIGGWQPRLDLASASEAGMAGLKAIGPAMAARVVAFRETGGLRTLEDLLSVAGIGPAKLEAIRPFAYVSPVEAARSLSTGALDEFRLCPAVASYVDLLMETGGTFGPRGTSLEASVLAEVARAAQTAAASQPPGGGPRPVSAEAAARLGRLILRGQALVGSAEALSEGDWVGLVSGPAYLDLALRLIDGAKREIRVTMFFMTYQPGGNHPANELVERLVAAQGRGVQVHVTLDLDRPGDVFGSRLVNEAAFRRLEAGGVAVTWDRPEQLTHTKLLLVDGRDVLTGSHNWTAGSLYAYDDKSLIVRSAALGEALATVT